MKKRISKSAEFEIDFPITSVFPLFSAIEESKWADGWEINLIYSENPVFEENMVFTTDSTEEDEEYLTWIISHLDEENHILKYTVSGLERIWTININCSDLPNDRSKVIVTYVFTGLTENGCNKNDSQINRIFFNNLQDWGNMINYYLKNGKTLKTNH